LDVYDMCLGPRNVSSEQASVGFSLFPFLILGSEHGVVGIPGSNGKEIETLKRVSFMRINTSKTVYNTERLITM
jgi:hypothetical protein